MRKFYLKGMTFALAFAMGAGVVTAEEKTSAVYSYGALEGGGYSTTPTLVTRNFYDTEGRLVRVLEADVMLCDHDLTVEVEVPGQEVARAYTAYNYAANGTLKNVTTRKYGIYDGYYRAWADATTTESYTYKNGELTQKTDATYTTTYVWSGDTLKSETAYYVKDGAWSNTVTYTDFLEGTLLPTTALMGDKWGNAYLYEYAYDEAGNKVSYREYKVTNAVKDENGVLIGGEKGALYSEYTWTYTDGKLTAEQKGYWNAGKEAVIPSAKVEYTIVGDTTTVCTYQYNSAGETWAQSGSTKKVVSVVIDPEQVATSPKLTDLSGVNAVKLTATAPENAIPGDWKVYRNGVCIGEATLTDGTLCYTDSLVKNGTWEYFLQQGDNYISKTVEKTFATKLTGAEGFQIDKNSLNADGDYELAISWPFVSSDYEVLGYNIYVDIPSVETNPLPHNGSTLIPADVARYTMTWDGTTTELTHDIYVETVYAIGKVRSAANQVTLQKTELTGAKLKKVQYLYGDVMGEAVADDVASKADVYYYTPDGKLQRIVNYVLKTGDDPADPDKFFKVGSWMHGSIIAYDYNDKGQLVHTRKRQYGMYSGYNYAWKDYEETGSFSYNEAGQLAEDTTTNRVYHYFYEGDNVVKEVYANSSNIIIYNKYYSDFKEGLTNCPQYAFANSPYGLTTNNRIYEYTYDDAGHMLTCRAYKYDSETIVKDDEGNIINAEKGTPDYEEIWTYSNGILSTYEKNTWSTSKNAYGPKYRNVYSPVPNGVKTTSYTYSVGIWARSGVPSVEWIIPFNEKVYLTDLTVSDVEGKVNTVKLTATRPSSAPATTKWNVFRNGLKIGQATYDGKNTLVYEDETVYNGNWDYFMQAVDEHGAEGYYISNVVEKNIHTELPAVENLRVEGNGLNKVKDYQLDLAWDAPQTELNLLGYNIFLDVMDITKNPSPYNDIYYFTEPYYTFEFGNDITKLEKSVIVEAVYNIGKKKSEPLVVTLSKESHPTDIEETITVMGNLTIQGNTVSVNGAYRSLEVYALNGARLAAYAGVPSVNLSELGEGVCIVRLCTADGVQTVKVAVK